MIVSYFNHGKKVAGISPSKAEGSARSAVNYLLGPDKDGNERSVAPELMRGNTENFVNIVTHGKQRSAYTSGVLRFTESDIDAKTLEDIMDSFEEATFPALEKDQYCVAWVKHQDKGGTELHFVFAGEELRTGNRLNAYVHAKDSYRINAWKEMVNDSYGFTNPDDPARRKLGDVANKKTLLNNKRELAENITNEIQHRIVAGQVKTRDDAIRFIEDSGLKVVRQTNTRISIENPAKPDGQPIALKGEAFHKDFQADPARTAEQIRQASATFNSPEARNERYQKSKETFDRLWSNRAKHNLKRYTLVAEKRAKAQAQEERQEQEKSQKRHRGKAYHRLSTYDKFAREQVPDFFKGMRFLKASKRKQYHIEQEHVEATPTNPTNEKENDYGRANDDYFERLLEISRRRAREKHPAEPSLSRANDEISKAEQAFTDADRAMSRTAEAVERASDRLRRAHSVSRIREHQITRELEELKSSQKGPKNGNYPKYD